MKYAVALIALIAAGLLLTMVFSGHRTGEDIAILAVAITSVCFFGSLPVLLGVRRAAKKSNPPTRIVVKDK